MTSLAVASPRSPSAQSLFRRLAAIVAVAGTALLAACETLGAAVPPKAPDVGIYELRTYTAAEGKMAALDARFRDHTIDLFKRHGMMPIAFFHPIVAPGAPADDRLVYLMGYKDRATRDAQWTQFANDPEWKQVYADSQKDGSLTSKIENAFFTAADYSPQLNMNSALNARVFELRTYTTNPGKLEDLHSRFRNHTLRIFARHGMTSVLYWRPTGGQPTLDNKMVYLLAYPSVEARNASWAAFSADEEWKKVAADSQKNGAILVSPGGVVSLQMRPTDYSPLK
jgi:hypothetical protein